MLLTCGAFAPAFSGGYLWCDDYTVADHPAMADRGGLAVFWRVGEREQFYPLTDSLYWVTTQWAGRDPETLHTLCISLHAACALLCFALLLRVSFPGAWLAAALFAIHPLQVESVAWIYELRNPWSLFLLLLTAHAHLRFVRGGSLAWLPVTLIAFAASLLAKSSGVVYPALAAVAALALGNQHRSRVLVSLLSLAVLAAASAVFTIWYEQAYTLTTAGEWPTSWLERVAIAGRAFWFYLQKFAWPEPLSFAYARDSFAEPGLIELIPAIAAGGGLLVLLLSARSPRVRPSALFAAAYTAAIFPVLGFFDIYAMRYSFLADHFSYLATLPLAMAIAGLIVFILRRSPLSAIALGLLITGSFTTLTVRRSMVFRDQETLWEDAAEAAPAAWLPPLQLGLLARQRGDHELAAHHFSASLERGDSVDARIDLANTLFDLDRAEASLPHYRRAIELAPADVANRISYGAALTQVKLFDDALGQYDRILELEPDNHLATTNRDAIRQLCAGLDSEIERLESIREQRPDDRFARQRLTDVLISRGLYAKALPLCDEWLAAEPEHAPAQITLLTVIAGPVEELLDPDRALGLKLPLTLAGYADAPDVERLLTRARRLAED